MRRTFEAAAAAAPPTLVMSVLRVAPVKVAPLKMSILKHALSFNYDLTNRRPWVAFDVSSATLHLVCLNLSILGRTEEKRREREGCAWVDGFYSRTIFNVSPRFSFNRRY